MDFFYFIQHITNHEYQNILATDKLTHHLYYNDNTLAHVHTYTPNIFVSGILIG